MALIDYVLVIPGEGGKIIVKRDDADILLLRPIQINRSRRRHVG